jgi:hypothetical protein
MHRIAKQRTGRQSLNSRCLVNRLKGNISRLKSSASFGWATLRRHRLTSQEAPNAAIQRSVNMSMDSYSQCTLDGRNGMRA